MCRLGEWVHILYRAAALLGLPSNLFISGSEGCAGILRKRGREFFG